MNCRVVKLVILLAALISSCNEIEKVLLLKTALESQTESLLRIRGIVVDVPNGQSIIEYGHCWSEKHEPSVNDQHTATLNTEAKITFEFISEISEFKGSQAYFFRSYIKMDDGRIHYGNALAINTGRVKGRWTQVPFENKYRVEMSLDWSSVVDVDISETALFQEIAFYKNDVYKFNGKINTWLKPEDSDTYKIASTAIYQSESESRIEKLENSEWTFFAKPPDFRGWGTLNILDGNFLYYGTGTKDFGGYAFNPPYEIYGRYDDYGFNNAFYRYEMQNGITQRLTSFPNTDCIFSTNFIIGSNIYKVSGWDGYLSYSQSVWRYNIEDDTWLQLNDFPGKGRMHAVSFVLQGKAYLGLGFTAADTFDISDYEPYIIPTAPVADFWEYDPVADRWTQLPDFPGGARAAAFSFSIQDLGYVGAGMVSFTKKYLKDFWRFDPTDKTWTRLEDFPGSPRFGASACANNEKAIVGLGWQISRDSPAEIPAIGDPYQEGYMLVPNIYYPELDADLWQFDPSRN